MKDEPQLPEADRLLRVAEVMDLLRLSRSKVYQLMESGVLPFVKLGRSRRIARGDMDRLIAQHRVAERPTFGAL
ncbi:MAG: helix-turn-helix domain-containing protein [Zavarzinella sp.]|nr:helix-turn-helix domain-containing protein [Zavarzinella sp.]